MDWNRNVGLMKPHVKLYMKFFSFGTEDFIPCEIPDCCRRAVDVHHIDARGMGGTEGKDVIENLMAMCREHHTQFGDQVGFLEYLVDIHLQYMETGPNPFFYA